jgi:hypothetical protein
MKAVLVLALGLSAQMAQAATQCADEVRTAVEAQAAQDFSGQDISVVIPDMNNVGEQTMETYKISVVDALNPNRTLGIYSIMVGETCQVMSGPTLVAR